MTDLNQKIRTKQQQQMANKLKGKDVDNVEDTGPYTTGTATKGMYNTKEPSTDEKFFRGGNKVQKGKVSGEEKSSGDSDQPRGVIIPPHKSHK